MSSCSDKGRLDWVRCGIRKSANFKLSIQRRKHIMPDVNSQGLHKLGKAIARPAIRKLFVQNPFLRTIVDPLTGQFLTTPPAAK
jgi:hypothetical protein